MDPNPVPIEELPKVAPPEKPAAIWARRSIILAFWAVVVCLGLPHWTWTTSIHRSTLPLESMHAWAQGRACQLQFLLHIALRAHDLNIEQATALASSLETLLNAQQNLRLHHFNVQSDTAANSTDNALLVILDTPSAQISPTATLRPWGPILHVQHSLQPSTPIHPVAVFLASEITKIFEDESASLFHLTKDTPFANGIPPLSLAPEKTAELDRRTTRAFKNAPSYHLTFSLFSPTSSPSAWEIDQALGEIIRPLLRQMSTVSEFTVDTQVQLFASFSPSITGPVFSEAHNRWTLRHDDLTGFINAAEWPLSPSIGSGPTVNFVLYVPSPEKRPLLIDGTGGTSWIIPQWGGVQIHNTLNTKPDMLTVEDLAPDLLVFADQLAALLGLPQNPPSLALRISSLTRERATALIVSASSTLGALARLTLKLTSIAIPDSVAKSVDAALSHLDKACGDLREGKYQSALENARMAEAEAEQAFFEPSMVGQVYFPEEHKVAVYVPLLGPMAVPLVMAALKEFKKFRERKPKTN